MTQTTTTTPSVIDIMIVDLLIVLNQVVKSTFVHLLTETPVRMNKTGNPYFGRVTKVSSCNYLIGNGYEGRVHINYGKEGLNPETFKVEENKVGEHLSKVVLFNEKLNRHYLQVERFDEIKPKVMYLCDGIEIDFETIKPYMIFPKKSDKQEQERYVSFISFNLENIKEITLNGTKYKVVK
jgi:hypothetical protein